MHYLYTAIFSIGTNAVLLGFVKRTIMDSDDGILVDYMHSSCRPPTATPQRNNSSQMQAAFGATSRPKVGVNIHKPNLVLGHSQIMETERERVEKGEGESRYRLNHMPLCMWHMTHAAHEDLVASNPLYLFWISPYMSRDTTSDCADWLHIYRATCYGGRLRR